MSDIAAFGVAVALSAGIIIAGIAEFGLVSRAQDQRPQHPSTDAQKASNGHQSTNSSQNNATGSNQQSKNNSAPVTIDGGAQINPTPANKIAGKSDSKTKCDLGDVTHCDLLEQRSMAESTRWMNYAAWASVVLTCLGILLIWRTLVYTAKAAKSAAEAAESGRDAVREAQRANEAAFEAVRVTQQAAEIELRSYLEVGISGTELPSYSTAQFRKVGAAAEIFRGKPIGCRVSVTNIGKIPARNVRIRVKASIGKSLGLIQDYKAFGEGTKDLGLIMPEPSDRPTESKADVVYFAKLGGEIASHLGSEAPEDLIVQFEVFLEFHDTFTLEIIGREPRKVHDFFEGRLLRGAISRVVDLRDMT